MHFAEIFFHLTFNLILRLKWWNWLMIGWNVGCIWAGLNYEILLLWGPMRIHIVDSLLYTEFLPLNFYFLSSNSCTWTKWALYSCVCWIFVNYGASKTKEISNDWLEITSLNNVFPLKFPILNKGEYQVNRVFLCYLGFFAKKIYYF